jgi:homogentisate 1,2-dioxygenase
VPHYTAVGEVPHKRHTQFRQPDGSLYSEELMGEEGFSSDSSLLYHRTIPSAITASRVWELPDLTTTPNHPLRPRHLRLHALAPEPSGDVVTGRRLVLGNADVRISYAHADAPSPLYRNATGDECVYVEHGTARVDTVFGSLEVEAGDYVVLPRATTHRWVPHEPLRAYVVEANGHLAPPKRYLSKHGQFLEHAPYCERDLRVPTAPLLLDDGDVDVHVKHRAGGAVVGSVVTHARSPFDVVGWDGCLYPWVFNVRDFEPITGRVHQPPTVHQVLEGRRSSSATSCRARSTTTRSRCRCRTTTPTSTATR